MIISGLFAMVLFLFYSVQLLHRAKYVNAKGKQGSALDCPKGKDRAPGADQKQPGVQDLAP